MILLTLVFSLLTSFASEGTIRVDASVPVMVIVDGKTAVQLFDQGSASFSAPAGPRNVVIMLNGSPNELVATVQPGKITRITAGKTGVSQQLIQPTDPELEVTTTFRVLGREPVELHLEGERLVLNPGDQKVYSLRATSHPMQVRSADGLTVFAKGGLQVLGTDEIVIHLSAGRAPEVIGTHGNFRPSRR